MRDNSRGGSRWLTATGRALRWQPASQVQVWLLAAGSGLIVVITGSALGAPLLLTLATGAFCVLGYGAGQSYRLQRRQDARVASDWADSRYQRPGG